MPERDISFEGKKKSTLFSTLILIPLAHYDILSHLYITWVIAHAFIKIVPCV